MTATYLKISRGLALLCSIFFTGCFYWSAEAAAPLSSYDPVQNEDPRLAPILKTLHTINHKIFFLLQADGVAVDSFTQGKTLHSEKGKQARHVLLKAQSVYLRLQEIKHIHGLKTSVPLLIEHWPPRTSATQVVSVDDIHALTDTIASDVADLLPLYGVAANIATPLPLAGFAPATTEDLYRLFSQISLMLDMTDIPPISPENVYGVALVVRDNARQVAQTLKIKNILPEKRKGAKIPEDAYAVTRQLHQLLWDLQTKYSLTIQGGITPTPPVQGQIAPSHVLDAVNNVAADLMAIKTALAIIHPPRPYKRSPGKTPTDVYSLLAEAYEALRHE